MSVVVAATTPTFRPSPHVFAEQTDSLALYLGTLVEERDAVGSSWWLVSKTLAERLETMDEVVLTDAFSYWWRCSNPSPEAALSDLGLTDYLH
ncbi:hypothetical protein SAMN05216214_1209 [Atopomonas hussainii]|uniref:Uncharacterized protein n=1 Tax=Atopomonas hussainii TaxID=1429083 RepID=A0A1H7SSM3_9GAMM|nr:hypothetical protein [Atopomonas hussainii]SEL74507.1 hypothetical protein SAMN05216214_1209 [Atopomonas hussainii]